MARKQFPGVTLSAWKGWLRLLRAGDRADVEQPAESVAVTTHPVTPVTAIVPMGVPVRGLDFDTRLRHMDEAAGALVDVAWPVDPETGRRGKVRNPMLLKSAHAAMAQAASLQVKSQEAAWSQERCQKWMENVIDTVAEVVNGAADHELARQIVEALAALDQRWESLAYRYGRSGIVPREKETADF
jgi:hypothetical protein